MIPPLSDPIDDQALDWVIRLRHADADDWAAFDRWMAADPAHAIAYWRVAAADANVAEALESPRPLRAVNPTSAAALPRSRSRFAMPSPAWGLAASVLIVAGGYWAFSHRPQPYVIETAAGVSRVVSLGDGTQIALNGDTRLRLDRAKPRTLRLDRGEASFDVVHDAGSPFVVEVGDASVRDVGTRFDVVTDANGLRVAVAEGAVDFEDQGTVQDLRAGEALVRGPHGRAEIRHVDPADVAAWKDRRLVFDRAPMTVVAADLARATGLDISVAPAVASRVFTGTIALGNGGPEAIVRAADLMDVGAERLGPGWSLMGRSAPR